MAAAIGLASRSKAKRIVIGVIGNDIHSVANRILAIGLRENGYDVCNLGVNSMPDDFVDAATEFDADAVIVSSLNGEGEFWCRDVRDRMRQAGLMQIRLYAGGNLVVGSRDPHEVQTLYKSYGFDRAYHMTSQLDVLFRDLTRDLAPV